MTKELINQTPNAIEYKANQAIGLAVLNVLDILSKTRKDKQTIIESQGILSQIYKETKNDYYLKKVKVIDKMLLANTDLKALVIEITSF